MDKGMILLLNQRKID